MDSKFEVVEKDYYTWLIVNDGVLIAELKFARSQLFGKPWSVFKDLLGKIES